MLVNAQVVEQNEKEFIWLAQFYATTTGIPVVIAKQKPSGILEEKQEEIDTLDGLLRRALYLLDFTGRASWEEEVALFVDEVRAGMCQCAVVDMDDNYALCPNEIGAEARSLGMCDTCYAAMNKKESIL